MALPPRHFFTILEVAGRWESTQAEIVCHAVAGHLELVVMFPCIHLGDRSTEGPLAVPASGIMPLFRTFGGAEEEVRLRQARPSGGSEWLPVTDPAEGFPIKAGDVWVTRPEVTRFEDEHGLGRGRGGVGAPLRYDWDGFYVALFKRIYGDGFPAFQKDLIFEMQEWFIANSDDGDAPDESTIRRRIRAVWQELNAA